MRRARATGFTLMEVMLAVFIIAVALLSLQAVVSGGLLSAGNSVVRRAAREICRARLELVASTDYTEGDGGEDETYHVRWTISREEKTVGASDSPTEKIVIVTVKCEYQVDGLAADAGGATEKQETFQLSTVIRPKEGS